MNKIVLAQNGLPNFWICAHQYAGEAVRHAASELQKYLLKSTNAMFPYFADRCPRRGPEIRIGEKVRGHESDLSMLQAEGFRIFTDGEDIVITGKTDRGILYGVYAFLEKYCGFRAYTAEVESIDPHDVLEIEAPDFYENPAFEYREAYFRLAFEGHFAAKCRFNGTMNDLSARNGGKVKWFNLHHAFRDLVQPEIYYEAHPEYFSLVDGERVKDSQLCLTNPEVLKIAKQTLRRWIRENPDCTVFSVAQNDNQRYCRCPNCRAVDEAEGTPQGSILRFVNALADDIAEDYPQILLHNFAYQYSTKMPKIIRARPNVIIRLCNIECRFDRPFEQIAAETGHGYEADFVQNIKDWQKGCQHLHLWSYDVDFRDYFIPFFQFHALAENYRMYARNGITGILEEGNFAYGGGGAMDDLKIYMISRLLWNPNRDADALIDEFLCGNFGAKVGKILREYVDLFEQACCSYPLTIYQQADTPYITDALIAKGYEIFRRALDATNDPALQRRIQREQLSLDFLDVVRLPMDTPNRDARVDAFLHAVKSFGITEVSERNDLQASAHIFKESRYGQRRWECKERYKLYYIMQ